METLNERFDSLVGVMTHTLGHAFQLWVLESAPAVTLRKGETFIFVTEYVGGKLNSLNEVFAMLTRPFAFFLSLTLAHR